MNPTINPEIVKLYKWGTVAFVGHASLSVFSLIFLLAVELRYWTQSSITPLELPYAFWMYFSLLIFVIPPIILAPITYHKLYKPLRNNVFTSKTRKWNLALSVLGFPYAFVVGGLFLTSAYKKMGMLGERIPIYE